MAEKIKSGSIAARVRELISDTVASKDCTLWDVEYVKEGADWVLRVTIDKQGGLSLTDCEGVHRAIEVLIDEADPIENSYSLEVTSPGLEKDLRIQEHFDSCIGQNVEVRLYKARDGVKKFVGQLLSRDNSSLRIMTGSGEITLDNGEVSKVTTVFEF